MTIDLIVTQPDNVPFTLWSRWVVRNHQRFNKIYIAIHKKNIEGYDFTDYIKELLKDATNIEFIHDINPMDGSDWRNEAVNKCLLRSTADYVWFTEQDFFMKNSNDVFDMVVGGVVGIMEGARVHPACLFVPRTVIEKTSKDFSSIEVDHFTRFTNEILRLGMNIEIIPRSQWFHLNGVTQNFTLVELKGFPNHDLYNFCFYAQKSSTMEPYNERYMSLVLKCMDYTPKPEIDQFLGEYL